MATDVVAAGARRDAHWYQTFFDEHWLTISSQTHSPEKSAAEVEFLVDELGLQAGQTVLDLPCGHGRHSIEFARRGLRVVGVDLNEEPLERAYWAAREAGVKVDLRRVDMPTFLYASREDHIVPWHSAYETVHVLPGKKQFVVGASGHIAGVINPPAKKKRSHWTNTRLPKTAEAWFEGATEHPGSWWPVWSDWLKLQAGKLVAAPKKPGDAKHPPIEPAPGRYVKAKA